MPVKKLLPYQKDTIAAAYRSKMMTVTELAAAYQISTRTIGRVLEERGLATPVARLKGEAYRAMKLLEEFGVSVDDLRKVLERDQARKASVDFVKVQRSLSSTAALFRPPNHA